MTIITLILIAVGMIVVERLWPANELPRVRNWWPRVVLVNAIQIGMVIIAGLTWDRWFQGYSVFNVRSAFQLRRCFNDHLPRRHIRLLLVAPCSP